MIPRALRSHLPALLITAAALALGMGGGGCESLSSPKLAVANAAPTERTDEGAAMVFAIDARNDNDVALPLRTVEYSVDLDGRRVFTGTRSAEATLRRRGSQQFVLPAVVNLTDPANAGIADGVRRYTLTGQVYYVTPGQLAEVLFDAGVRTPSESFNFEGEIDFNAPPIPAMPVVAPRRIPPQQPRPAAPGSSGQPTP